VRAELPVSESGGAQHGCSTEEQQRRATHCAHVVAGRRVEHRRSAAQQLTSVQRWVLACGSCGDVNRSLLRGAANIAGRSRLQRLVRRAQLLRNASGSRRAVVVPRKQERPEGCRSPRDATCWSAGPRLAAWYPVPGANQPFSMQYLKQVHRLASMSLGAHVLCRYLQMLTHVRMRFQHLMHAQ
jgi:hypothetical protein